MKILVFNTGSTSLRFAVINSKSDNEDDFSQDRTLASGIVRGIGSDAVLKKQENKQTVDRIFILHAYVIPTQEELRDRAVYPSGLHKR